VGKVRGLGGEWGQEGPWKVLQPQGRGVSLGLKVEDVYEFLDQALWSGASGHPLSC
jgi:hypothetical protein